jgi:hypothetical protein
MMCCEVSMMVEEVMEMPIQQQWLPFEAWEMPSRISSLSTVVHQLGKVRFRLFGRQPR